MVHQLRQPMCYIKKNVHFRILKMVKKILFFFVKNTYQNGTFQLYIVLRRSTIWYRSTMCYL